jgi:carbonic anhydrase
MACRRNEAEEACMSQRHEIAELFERNRAWAQRMRERDADFFHRLSSQQAPHYLWIGCADSRVPANEIVDLRPGKMFVHRNVGNLVVHTDMNCLSVIQFAVDVLGIEHAIVCGHYGCSGVRAALRKERLGLSDNWLRHLRDVYARHESIVANDEKAAVDRLCELNVVEQVANVCGTGIVQDAWARGQPFEVHGLIYGLEDGLLQDLGMDVASADGLEPAYYQAIDKIRAKV